MRLSNPALLQALLLLSSPLPTTAVRAKPQQPANSVLLSNIKTLTLRSSAQTSSRRVPSIPQLSCVGGNARDLYTVDVLRCRNAGSDYDDANVQWTCQASLPPEFKLGSTDVICEGYDGPEDPFVLKGSCGVEYRLVLTEEGEERYGRREDVGGGGSTRTEKLWFFACLSFIVAVFGYGIWQSCTGRGGRAGGAAGGGWGGGWGGGDDGDDNDPPPPYTPQPPKWARSRQPQQQGNQQWRPGFWTGTAAGAAAGYLAGGRNATRQTDPQVGSSRWANRGGGGGRSSSPQPSSSRYESTGFGDTRRR